MTIATVLTSIVDNGMMRIVLFIMILIAVALILTGSFIALMTLYNQRKTRTVNRIGE